MGVWDEVRFGAGVAGVQDVGNVVLLYQVLENKHRFGSEPDQRGWTPRRAGILKNNFFFFFLKSVRGQGCDVGVVLCHLVEDVPLAAQVQVRQNTGWPDVGDGQAGLRDAGRNQGGLPLTETRKKVRELREPT